VKDTKKPAEQVTFVYAAAKMPGTTLIFEMFLSKPRLNCKLPYDCSLISVFAVIQ